METQLVNRYAVNTHCVLSCYDSIVITSTLPGACYAAGTLESAAAGLEVNHVSQRHIRTEELV